MFLFELPVSMVHVASFEKRYSTNITSGYEENSIVSDLYDFELLNLFFPVVVMSI